MKHCHARAYPERFNSYAHLRETTETTETSSDSHQVKSKDVNIFLPISFNIS